jgi:M3 family oligoendopeptidase
MKFKAYPYERPDMVNIQKKIVGIIEKIKKASNSEEVLESMAEINRIRKTFETMAALASIRYTQNTNDVFYENEKEAIDEMAPDFESLVNQYFRSIIASPYLDRIEEYYGKHFLALINVKLKAFDDSIIDELKEEGKLMQAYTKLRTSAKIFFEGEVRNLPQMGPFYESQDKNIRRAAHLATSKFFNDNLNAFDELYDKMVKVRHRMAQKMGFENYIPLGYLRLMRTDYNAEDVARYRSQVKQELIPLTSMLREKQRQRLGLSKLAFADEGITFLSGNAKPIGTADEILAKGLEMYHALSAETATFIDFLYDRELLDVEAREGKAGGGYCSFIHDHKSPFIFSNFNGTSGDVDVLTHEAGHAFQIFQSRDYELPDFVWPTLEACEIHSMSMEFMTWPYMEKFFGDKADKYRYHHLTEALLFIPYGTLVDEFQHEIYANPDLTPAERRAKWRSLERVYLPHRDYEDDSFLESGGYWFRQGHIFTDPFYYIDYTLAQVCAFQFHMANQKHHESAWERYLKLCQLGGSQSFLSLVKSSELDNPFEEGTIKKIVAPLAEWLKAQNDQAFNS